MMSSPSFCVLYRWRLVAGSQAAFEAAWSRVTLRLRHERAGMGSRLHRAEDDCIYAYAQWPSREAWQRSQDQGPIDQKATDEMAAAIVERFAPILLTPLSDLLSS